MVSRSRSRRSRSLAKAGRDGEARADSSGESDSDSPLANEPCMGRRASGARVEIDACRDPAASRGGNPGNFRIAENKSEIPIQESQASRIRRTWDSRIRHDHVQGKTFTGCNVGPSGGYLSAGAIRQEVRPRVMRKPPGARVSLRRSKTLKFEGRMVE